MKNLYTTALDAIEPTEQKKQEMIQKVVNYKNEQQIGDRIKTKNQFKWNIRRSIIAASIVVIILVCAILVPIMAINKDSIRQQITDLENQITQQTDKISKLKNEVENLKQTGIANSMEWDEIVDNTINEYHKESPNVGLLRITTFRATSYPNDSGIVDGIQGHGTMQNCFDEFFDILIDSKERFEVSKTDENLYEFETKRNDGFVVWNLNNGWNWTPESEKWDFGADNKNYPVPYLNFKAKVENGKIVNFSVLYEDERLSLSTSYFLYMGDLYWMWWQLAMLEK